jgi:hypothetical protein
MRSINLNQNKVVYVDDEDFERLSQFHWIYRPERDGETGYAIRHAKVNNKNATVYLHRELMNPPPGYAVIFKNHDRLDCRKENLAVVTTEESRRSHRVRTDSKTGIKGVRFNPGAGTWTAFVYRNGHYCGLGTFDLQMDAMKAYVDAVIKEMPHLANAPEVIDREAKRRNQDAVQTDMSA